jgi:hypothetical protein
MSDTTNQEASGTGAGGHRRSPRIPNCGPVTSFVNFVGALPPEKQSTPAAVQSALAESVGPFWLRSGG